MDQRRNPMQVCAVVGGSAMLVSRHTVFVTVRAFCTKVRLQGGGKGGLVVHHAVAQGPNDRLHGRNGTQNEERGADRSAQGARMHTEGRNLHRAWPDRQRGHRPTGDRGLRNDMPPTVRRHVVLLPQLAVNEWPPRPS